MKLNAINCAPIRNNVSFAGKITYPSNFGQDTYYGNNLGCDSIMDCAKKEKAVMGSHYDVIVKALDKDKFATTVVNLNGIVCDKFETSDVYKAADEGMNSAIVNTAMDKESLLPKSLLRKFIDNLTGSKEVFKDEAAKEAFSEQTLCEAKYCKSISEMIKKSQAAKKSGFNFLVESAKDESGFIVKLLKGKKIVESFKQWNIHAALDEARTAAIVRKALSQVKL